MSSTNFKLQSAVNDKKKGEPGSPFFVQQIESQVFVTPPFKTMAMRINMMMARMP